MPSITVPQNIPILLHGSVSDLDVDINTSTYLWSLISGPDSPTITNSTTLEASFTPTSVGEYVIEFTVEDFMGLSDTDTLTVTSTAP